jgi:hypothetical protein
VGAALFGAGPACHGGIVLEIRCGGIPHPRFGGPASVQHVRMFRTTSINNNNFRRTYFRRHVFHRARPILAGVGWGLPVFPAHSPGPAQWLGRAAWGLSIPSYYNISIDGWPNKFLYRTFVPANLYVCKATKRVVWGTCHVIEFAKVSEKSIVIATAVVLI